MYNQCGFCPLDWLISGSFNTGYLSMTVSPSVLHSYRLMIGVALRRRGGVHHAGLRVRTSVGPFAGLDVKMKSPPTLKKHGCTTGCCGHPLEILHTCLWLSSKPCLCLCLSLTSSHRGVFVFVGLYYLVFLQLGAKGLNSAHILHNEPNSVVPNVSKILILGARDIKWG